MSPILIAQLLAAFGPSAIQLIDTLIANMKNNAPVTVDQWQALSASLKLTAADRMKAQLAAANIDPASPQGVALLALVS